MKGKRLICRPGHRRWDKIKTDLEIWEAFYRCGLDLCASRLVLVTGCFVNTGLTFVCFTTGPSDRMLCEHGTDICVFHDWC